MLTFEDKKTKKNVWGLNFWWEKAAFVIGAVWFWLMVVSFSFYFVAGFIEAIIS